MKSTLSLAILALNCGVSLAIAGPAISISGGSGGTPTAGSSHGWEFTANEPIIVTHLGLYDSSDDGMEIPHPIGIFRLNDAALLTSGTINAGVGDVLLDSFRYVDTPDITLESGMGYVIAYYSATDSGDNVITSATGLSTDSAITYGPSRRWETSTGGLVLPANMTPDDRIGPNFLFVVPEPSTLTLAGIGLLWMGYCRSKQR